MTAMSTCTLGIVSDIHYAGAAEQARGDDYELLFTVGARMRGRFRGVLRHAGDVRLRRIGLVTKSPSVVSGEVWILIVTVTPEGVPAAAPMRAAMTHDPN